MASHEVQRYHLKFGNKAGIFLHVKYVKIIYFKRKMKNKKIYELNLEKVKSFGYLGDLMEASGGAELDD